jgi:hypothetical protein
MRTLLLLTALAVAAGCATLCAKVNIPVLCTPTTTTLPAPPSAP